MFRALKSVFDSNENQLKKVNVIFKQIKDAESKIKDQTFEEFRTRIGEMKEELKPLVEAIPDENKMSLKKVENRKVISSEEKKIQNKLMEFLPEVYAMMNEAYKRKMGFGYHDVQLKAAIILAQGQRLVEQYTGEGKTMTFQLPLTLYSLAGRGSHLVTVNDYLTKIGAEYAGHTVSELGVSIGIITPDTAYKFITDSELKTYKSEEDIKIREEQKMSIDSMTGVNLIECSKRDAYACDITYGTNNEFGFDYLRDNMAWELNRLSQRELYFCIIDEADSILIDEARTPLIISATPSDADTEKYTKFADCVKNLEDKIDYEVDHKSRSVSLTEEGMKKVESILNIDNAWADYSIAYHLENALKAKTLFHNDEEYIVRNGEVLIVDEFTGRVLSGRRYSEGLHQAIEAKEGVAIQQESRTYATITFQNFFRLYKILSGGSGTVMTEGEEFYKIYGLETVVIPTNKPNIRIDHSDRIYKTSDAKWKAVANEIKEMNTQGRPVLVGTTSVENSEILSRLLDENGIAHQVLNAKFHEQESKIVAKAGIKGAVTVATNMAGRGTDIVIGGGRRGDETWKEIADLGGLHVIGTERHDARRIDNQLRGRTGRQGEPGSTRFYVSLEDKIMRVLGGEIIAKLMNIVKVPDDMPIEMKLISKQIEMAQRRVESLNFENRKRVVDYDDVMNQHREIFYTRRKNILTYSENAMGKIIDAGKFITVNLKELDSASGAYKAKIEHGKVRLKSIVTDIVNDEIDSFIGNNIEKKQYSEEELVNLVEKINNLIPLDLISKVKGKDTDELKNELSELIKVNNTYELEDTFNQTFEYKINEFEDDLYNLVKYVSLEEMDKKWIDHLEVMKGIREGIGLQSYAQRDPLVEYQNKAYQIFISFINSIDTEVTRQMFRLNKVQRSEVVRQQPVKLETNEAEVEDILTGDREILQSDTAQADKVLNSIQRRQQMQQSLLRTNSADGNGKGQKSTTKTYGRNDRVNVKYSDGKIVNDVKYKKIEADIEGGMAEIIE